MPQVAVQESLEPHGTWILAPHGFTLPLTSTPQEPPLQPPPLISPLQTPGKANVFTVLLVLTFFNSCIIQAISVIPG